MSILVTGSSGFIGARIVTKLLERGEEVVCFDQTPLGDFSRSRPSAGVAHTYRGDVTQLAHLLDAVVSYGVTRVVHMAALLPPISEERPSDGFYVNIQGTNNVFEIARMEGLDRVVYASSIAVYGAQESHGQRSLTEDDWPNPANVYGMTKAVNDFSARMYRERFNLDLRGIRICTVFGHGRTTGATGAVGGLLISNPAVGIPVKIPVHAEDASAMIYVEDAAEIFVRAALSITLRHPIYITGGHLATVGTISNIVKRFLPDAEIVTGEMSIPHAYLFDNSRMLADIGYEMPSLDQRVFDQVNEARAEAEMEPIASGHPL